MTNTATNDSISAQVAALPGLPMKDLWALWDAHFPRRPAHTNRNYVESRLAYRRQVCAAIWWSAARSSRRSSPLGAARNAI